MGTPDSAEAIFVSLDGGRETMARHYPAVERTGDLLVLAHGAGAGQQHPWMVAMAAGLAARGIDVVTFDFPYVHQRRRVPDRPPILEAAFQRVVAVARGRDAPGGTRLFIGGKSMGGRIATHLSSAAAAPAGLAGTVCLGYPLHPPGRPDRPRVTHLPSIAVPVLVVQGERDPFGGPDAVAEAFQVVPAAVTIHPVAGGDHSFAVRRSPAEVIRQDVLDTVRRWMQTTTGA